PLIRNSGHSLHAQIKEFQTSISARLRLLRTVRPRMQKSHLRKRRARTAMRRPVELNSPSSQPIKLLQKSLPVDA
ncbi:hypothetical protein, partial [Caballeronia sp. GAWG1-1]|uniref:hypothetical protein n=1 Tax=Caballeronia sp. GAWG1-1 TaxID=2921742 RepID=UPI0020286971